MLGQNLIGQVCADMIANKGKTQMYFELKVVRFTSCFSEKGPTFDAVFT